MPADAMTMQGEFNQPWPEVLIHIRDWIQYQVALIHYARRFEIHLRLSRELLTIALNDGKKLQPYFDDFRLEIANDFLCEIKLASLHDNGPHRIELSYWR